ncbi:MAG TPA: DNA-3-methyladenine glycosylase [Abditibacterium sp.]
MNPPQHLREADPVLGAVIDRIGELEPSCPIPEAHFSALCRIVTGQQLSVAVARSIWNRVETHFGPDISPAAVLETSEEDLRKLGLSSAKTRTFHALAAHVTAGKLKIGELETLSDEEIAREIVAVKGLGPWSADMFLMFHLCRPDVLPVGDLGIKEAMKRLYDLEKRPTVEEMERIAEKWRPFRTLASRYLWRSLDSGE